MEPIFAEDVPFIKEFLNTPRGQEKEAWARWRAYWDKSDFEKRFDELFVKHYGPPKKKTH